MRDLARNSCYLALCALEQDVRSFWKFVDEQALSDPQAGEALPSAMVVADVMAHRWFQCPRKPSLELRFSVKATSVP
jgi:hypothetical protein